MRMRYYDAPLEIKEIDDAGKFSGHASVFRNVDEAGDVVEPGAFQETLQKKHPAMLWQHDTREPIGTWQDLVEDKKGLRVEGELALGVARADQAHRLMKMRPPGIRGLSIGFDILEGGSEMRRGVRRLKTIDLWEISIVTFPANRRARINAVKMLIEGTDLLPTKTDFEALLCDLGLSHKESRLVMRYGYDGLLMTRNEDRSALNDLLASRNGDSGLAARVNDLAAQFGD